MEKSWEKAFMKQHTESKKSKYFFIRKNIKAVFNIDARQKITIGTEMQPKFIKENPHSANKWYNIGGMGKTMAQKQKSRIEMQLLLRIFRFCNPQRKRLKLVVGYEL